MTDLSSLLERADHAVSGIPLPTGDLERLRSLRDHKRRNQRIAAGGVGIAVFVAAVWIVTTGGPVDRTQTPAVPRPTVPPPSERVGFIGLPPEGAMPSTPEHGKLVLHFYGGTTSGPRTEMWAYADGRLIWRQEGAGLSYGANPSFTGYLEQHLSPEGVELLTSEAISTGLFDRDRLLLVGSVGPCGNLVEVRSGDSLVRLDYSRGCGRGGLHPASPEQIDAITSLDGRLGDPASWLPATAWEDPEIRAYVPSTFAVCNYGHPIGDSVGAARLLALLPPSAADLLRAKDPVPQRNAWLDPSEVSQPIAFGDYCFEVTSEEARVLADAFDQAGYERDEQENLFVLAYTFAAPEPINRVTIWFEPIFPHGDWTCSSCG